ncbi:MAG: OmpA family protein [Candidatus Kapaibacterium sp.]|nr:OmpA family protein [Ignavibacteria bacterium]
MRKYLLILLTPFILISSQKDNALRLGVLMGGNYVQNETRLPVIQGDTCCGEFNNGNEIGFYTGLSFNYELLYEFISADVRVLFDSRPANLNVNTNNYQIYNPNSRDYEFATIQNDIEATLNYFVFDFGLKIRPVNTIPVAIRLGFDFSDASITKSFSQTRHIIEPSGLQLNGETIETVSEGDFNNLSVSQGLSGSLIADIELNESIILSPELSYRYPINSSMDDIDWMTTLIRAGATISVRLNPPQNLRNEEIIIDTIPVIEENKSITDNIKNDDEIDLNAINSINIEDLTITETIVTQTYPILPYLFFDSSSSKLPNKYYYRGDTKNFSEEYLEKNSLKIYERLLDIVGQRLKKSSGKLTIKGFTDGKEKPTYDERKDLAFARASSVKNYLVTKWDINQEDLKIEVSDIPNQPTSSNYIEGLAENRRVELSPDDISLLKPIVHSQFMEFATDKNRLKVNLDTKSNEINDYTIIVKDDNKQIFNQSIQDKITNEFTIYLNNELIDKIANSKIEKLELELLVTKNNGRIESKTVPFKVIKESNDFELGRLNLIVFDFDKSVISDANRNMIDKFIVNNISSKSNVDIIGSTDLLGEQLYNKELSQQRANNVADYISTLLPNIKYNKVIGVGSNNPKFDNSSPEGRFYCRTVLIEVKTPIKID